MEDLKAKPRRKTIKSKFTSVIKSFQETKTNNNSDKEISESEIIATNKKKLYGPRVALLKLESKKKYYLPKSEENLISTCSHFKRNSSDSRLNERYTRTRSTSSNQESAILVTRISLTESENEDIELRKPKPSSLKRVWSNSFRSSIRVVRMIRTLSEGGEENNITKEERNYIERNRRFQKRSTATSPITMQPPAPLVVEDPPSTDDETLNDLRSHNPAFLNGSSGNFGSSAPRSAPTTPQGQLGAPHGGPAEPLASPTIQRSPSHSVFSKVDKASLKHLSTSTPAMTAQGQLAEPPSPKATKDPKVHTTSKARQKKFLRHFPNVEEDEKVLNHYSCALIGDILLQGHLYITKNYFAFYSNVFGYVTKLLIPILTVEEITKEKTARIIPNAVGITTTSEDKHIFGSLMSRDSTLAYMRTVWEKAKREEALPDPVEIMEEQDSSETGESGRESPTLESVPSGTDVLASAKFDRMRKESVRNQAEGSLLERKGSKGLVRTLKDAITEFRKLPRQSLILVATTLLLILLFLSAAVLLYRINKIQNKYSISLQSSSLSSTSEDIYSDLLQWQTHLHSRSADAVNGFLDNNLDQIAKVRQSLEALSTLLNSQTPPSTQESTSSTQEKVVTNDEKVPSPTVAAGSHS